MSMRYVGMSLPRSLPKGRVLVHNDVQHDVDTPPGIDGFRAWTQGRDDGDAPAVTRCNCGWSELAHYRVRSVVARQRAARSD